MPILTSIMTLLSLLLGLTAGEVVAMRAFGRPKASMLILDMVLFAVVVSCIYAFVGFTQTGVMFMAINFVIGTGTVMIVRGIETTLRMTERPGTEHKIAANIIRELSRHGLDEDEIKGVLKRSGISPKTVDRLSDMIQSSVPAYVPKLVKMEMDISDIKQGMEQLGSSLHQLRTNELRHLKGSLALGRRARLRTGRAARRAGRRSR